MVAESTEHLPQRRSCLDQRASFGRPDTSVNRGIRGVGDLPLLVERFVSECSLPGHTFPLVARETKDLSAAFADQVTAHLSGNGATAGTDSSHGAILLTTSESIATGILRHVQPARAAARGAA